MSQTIVLYDGACPLCRAQMKFLRQLDWNHRLTLRPLDDPQAEQLVPEAQRGALHGAIHCIASDGQIYRGARAIRCFGGRVPLLLPLAWFLWIPGVMFFAEIIYGWIARHRLALGHLLGCQDACALPQAPDRSV